MFDSHYAFRLVSSGKVINEYPLIARRNFSFWTIKKRRYLVLIHEYEYKVFVIKFCDARFKNHANRFSMVLNDFDFPKILRTVVEIAKQTLDISPSASFAFVGVHKEGKETKKTANTQRHRIYTKVTEYFLGGETFLHSYEKQTNCYLLVNRINENPEALHKTIVDMFADEFSELSHLQAS